MWFMVAHFKSAERVAQRLLKRGWRGFEVKPSNRLTFGKSTAQDTPEAAPNLDNFHACDFTPQPFAA